MVKNGDGGMTNLIKAKNVPKSDVRIELLGTLEELSGHLELVKVRSTQTEVRQVLGEIKVALDRIAAVVLEPHNNKHKLSVAQLELLEREIERMNHHAADRAGDVVTEHSAQIEIACAVARRCERVLSSVTIKYGSDKMTKQYLNRLAEYLSVLAREAETRSTSVTTESDIKDMDEINERVIKEVLKRIGRPAKLTLQTAKQIIAELEIYAQQQGQKAVLAVCGPDGNPIAVHVMDDAYLVSFEVAIKKAYTAAAVKISTMELGKLVKPGEMFQGLDKLQEDKMVFFGGGVPLMCGGELIGAIGVSGGTGEEDHLIAEYGRQVFENC